LFRSEKIPDSPEASGPDPSRADSRSLKTKKARQILADLSGLPSQAKPTSLVVRRWLRSEFLRPAAAQHKTKHLLHDTARVHLRE
jgi:hypothetical protein